MNLINESVGDYRPEQWDILDHVQEHDRGLNKLRLQTAFGAINRQRAALRAVIAAVDRAEERSARPEGALQRLYLRDGLVDAHTSCTRALQQLSEASGQNVVVYADPLPDPLGYDDGGDQPGLPF